MDSKQLNELSLAYQAVYNEELKEQFEDELFSELEGIEDLSDEEIDEIAEEVIYELLDEGSEFDEIEEEFGGYLTEAKMSARQLADRAARQKEYAKASEKSAKEARKKGEAVVRREKRAERIEKLKSSMKAGVKKAKETAKATGAAVKQKARDIVDPQIGKYAAKKGLGGPGAGLKLRAKDPEKRRSVRAAVAKHVAQRIASKPERVAKAAGEKAVAAKKGAKKGLRGALLGLARRLKEEGGEIDTFDGVAAYLIDEGFASDFDHAQDIMVNLDSKMIEEVYDHQVRVLRNISK